MEETHESKKGLIYDKVKNVADDGIEEERSLVSGKVEDDEKISQVLVEEEIVKLICSESMNVVDKTSPYIEELDDYLTAAYGGDFELTGKETSEATKVEIGEKEETSIVVSEVNNAVEGGDKISVLDIVSTCEFSDEGQGNRQGIFWWRRCCGG